jgi:hypothetical protein
MISWRGGRKTEKALGTTGGVIGIGEYCEKTASIFEFNVRTTR